MVSEKIYALISSNACKTKLEFGFPKLWSIFGHGAIFKIKIWRMVHAELCLSTNLTCVANLILHCQGFKTKQNVILNVNFITHVVAFIRYYLLCVRFCRRFISVFSILLGKYVSLPPNSVISQDEQTLCKKRVLALSSHHIASISCKKRFTRETERKFT